MFDECDAQYDLVEALGPYCLLCKEQDEEDDYMLDGVDSFSEDEYGKHRRYNSCVVVSCEEYHDLEGISSVAHAPVD